MIWGGNLRSFPPAFSIQGFNVGGRTVLFAPFDLFTCSSSARVMVGARRAVPAHRPGPADARGGVRAGGLAAARRARRPDAHARLGAGRVGRLAGRGAGRALGLRRAQRTSTPVLVFGFTAAVLGGLDSPPGALVGGLILGLALSYVSGYVGAEMVALGALVILIVVLMVRPNGLFARAERGGCSHGARRLPAALAAPPGDRARRAASSLFVLSGQLTRSTTCSWRPWPTTSSRSPA